jgi:diguanylate cyclase (GGDEF)-like protein/PAS domain S-box-containing protein
MPDLQSIRPPESLVLGDVLATIGDASLTLDRDWRFTYVSESAERLLFQTPEQLVGRSMWEAFPQSVDTVFWYRYHQAMDKRERVVFTEFYEPLDCWFEITAAPFSGGLMVFFHDVNELKRAEGRLRVLHAEQAALRRVATAVANEEHPEQVLALVAEEAARLLGGQLGSAVRILSPQLAEVAGTWTSGPEYLPVGTPIELIEGTELAEVLFNGQPLFVNYTDKDVHRRAPTFGYHCTILSPILAGPRVWGALAVASVEPDGLKAGSELVLEEFAHLCSTAVLNAENRRDIVEQAATDPLTGLANHRAFHERIHHEISRALRHQRDLSLVVLDIDHFKIVNDTAGHQLGDELLRRVAAELQDSCRDEDFLARIGGDEFALILPETGRMTAYGLVERMRARVSASPLLENVSVTLSAGVCDLTLADTADELFRLADGALYWSKSHGRDAVWVYDPEVIQDLSAADRAAHLERQHTLAGINALARAIDAKDPSTRRHSERVAWYAARLAERMGWPPDRVRALHQTGLVHDIGKVGVPDEILLKDGCLTDGEFELIKQHSVLGAQIVEDVLPAEQVEWVRWHHERPDGRGYPDGLRAGQIPAGAIILALADSWDVMTSHRPYSPPKPVEQALAECESLRGQQFDADVVETMRGLVADGYGICPDDARLTSSPRESLLPGVG